ncbi:polyphosphate kinase 1 [Litoribrevibacter albus]|uniref:Polyphosphate kinase n=1 Tax=Litoribrevibacter albus TaxID=1473156 RepID=A0AA37SDG3_9GAMM|nr:polyphosphate kinase 1 [Litoribrevibacter albus]GLQ33076.1 polyphosphate kinase [Litoribrevibacter albus]
MTTQATEETTVIDLDNPELYINRELSLIKFNERVLAQAMDERHPLLQRLLFLCIFSSNTDEFFEIRVAELKRQIEFGQAKILPDGMIPEQALEAISEQYHPLVERQYEILNDIILPALREEGIRFLRREEWTEQQEEWINNFFNESVMPVMSPVGLDPSHPFPRLVNKTLNFIVELDGKDAFGRETGLAILPAPRSLPRVVRLPDEICDNDGDNLVFLSSIIHAHAGDLFPGMTIDGCYQFRLTRNADLEIDETEEDLANALRSELLSRRYGDAVRLEVANNCPDELVEELLKRFNLSEDDLYRVDGPVNLARLMQTLSLVKRPDLQYDVFTPGLSKALKLSAKNNIFDEIRKSDRLLHHPFESFTPVVNLLMAAAKDPNVIAIKQTLYRTGEDSDIVNALCEAARNGKEVTAVIELRARFDEEDNINLASRLQESGALVTYGVVGHKTHAKMMLILRRENQQLKRYAHLGTGNYHAGTAKLYTDYGYLTANDEITYDTHRIFQQLTGMGKIQKTQKLMHAPFTLHKGLIDLINKEAAHAKEGLPAKIIIKCNGLTEPKIIKALYKASQAGVSIDLIIRSMCSLRPGIPGVSENIRVRSIVGRFLEHTRIFYFENNGSPKLFGASADWMERNLINRVETCFPIEPSKLKKRMIEELNLYLQDNCQSWELQTDDTYVLNQPEEGEEAISAQSSLLERLALRA